MNDPWDVKSVRQSGQYVSCMKFNGVPLLPPVLSKECRKEMQYYKLLAREVEKRITLLQPYIDTDNDSVTTEDKTDAPELPESEQIYILHPEQAGFNRIIDKATEITCEKTLDNSLIEYPKTDLYSCLASNIPFMDKAEDIQTTNSPKYVIDLSLHINETGRTALDSVKPLKISPPVDLPERDYNCLKKQNTKEILMDTESPKRHMKRIIKEDYHYKVDKDILSDSFPGVSLNHDGPSSLSCKSFTGSLNDLNIESAKESHMVTNLVRQSSYTLLKPSPQLLAHLEIQSLNAGVEINSISMSESLSNLSSPGKKRRSWDLESAKAKWSNMALELKQKKIPDGVKMKNVPRPASKKIPQATLPRAQSVIPDKPRRGSVSKTLPKSEPVQKPKRSLSPVRKSSNRTIVKEPISPKLIKGKMEPPHPSRQLISESEDPATRVRELYEKIQKQQLIQMASLVEKQKKEQILLQQVFEEQNNMLYKQLKVICPKSPIEVKDAWVDQLSVDRGPVSLSQLINQKSPDQSIYDSPVSSTLTDTNNCINHCDNVLKKSRDLSGSIKKQQQPKSRNQNDTKIQSQTSLGDGSRTRTHSPNQRFTPISRKLNYDTSASSEREYDPILTDRTNDTMADLNVTFPSDHTDEYFYSNHDNTVNNFCDKEVTVIHKNAVQNAGVHHRSTESAIKHIERILPNSKCVRNDKSKMFCNPTPQQREAASKIVAHAKGFLVRRLMRTERVQGTVQTIKDALLCALQLHQDREGIRGADVDLHRRLIQQITAACYSLHDTFIASTAGERCAMIAADRGRRRSLAARQPPPKPFRQTDIMSQSHSGTFPSRAKRPSAASLMTQSNYETFSGDKCSPVSRSRYMPSPRRRPWR